MSSPDSTAASPPVAGSDGAVHPAGTHRGRLTAGTWIYVLPLLYLIFFLVRGAHQHQWTYVAGDAVVLLALLAIPTGGMKWLRHALNGRKHR
jgi:hypothetical protein